MINYDSQSGVDMTVSTLAASRVCSTLTLASIDRTREGNYSCRPSMVQENTYVDETEVHTTLWKNPSPSLNINERDREISPSYKGTT